MVYCNILCPRCTEGLVIYPAGTTSVPVSHECAANAAVTGGGLMCAPNGTWSGSPSCGCNPGHQIVGSECQGIVLIHTHIHTHTHTHTHAHTHTHTTI